MHPIVWILLIIIVLVIISYVIKCRFYDVRISGFTNGNDDDGYINDISQFNRTKVDRVFYPVSKSDIVYIVKLAKTDRKHVAIRGTKHSMGGHTISKGGYIIDMSGFNKVNEFDEINGVVVVEPGMTWSQLILFLDPYGLSPMTLQSYSSFSIGGTVSVNAHGITNDYGIYQSIIELGIIDPTGKEVICSRTINPILMSLVVGGYGLFGIITYVKLKLVKNTKLHLEFTKLNKSKFHSKYQEVLNDDSVAIKIARININNMNDINLYVFREEPNNNIIISKVHKKNPNMSKLSQLLYKWAMPDPAFQKIRYKIESITEKPIDITMTKYERNLILYESAEPLAKLYSPLIDINATHILQEFFVPPNRFMDWMDCLKQTFKQKYKYVTLLNITIRYVRHDDITFINYAKEDMYAFVLYYRLPKRTDADDELHEINQKLTNGVIDLDGTFYLPYRHHYTKDQLKACYPQIDQFFKLKREHDPENIFSNQWYEKFDNIS